MSRTNRSTLKRLEALEAQSGAPRDDGQWDLVLQELSDHALDEVEKLYVAAHAAAGVAEDQELVLTVDQEIELEVILTVDAADAQTLARWKSWAGMTRPEDEEVDQQIDDQVRKLILDRASRREVSQ